MEKKMITQHRYNSQILIREKNAYFQYSGVALEIRPNLGEAF